MWFEKMIHTIQWGLSNIEELEKVEAEEAVKVGSSKSEIPLIYLHSNIDELLILIVDWSSIFPILPFSPRLLTDLGIPDIIETLPDIRSNS